MEIKIEETYHSARKYARRYGTIGVSDYEDIAQVAMIKLFSSGQKPNSKNLISRIVRNVATDFHRKSTVSQPQCVCLVEENIEEFMAYSTDEVEIDVIPQLNKILNNLREPMRDALVLHAEGYSYEEIAAMTGTSIGTAKTRVHYTCKFQNYLSHFLQN